MSREIEVRIYGQVYKVKGDDPARIGRAAGLVDRSMREALGPPGGGLNARDAVLAALFMADGWLTGMEENRGALADLGERTEELIGMLPE